MMITNSENQLLERINFIFDMDFNSIDQAYEDVEKQVERELSDLLPSLGIRASIKTDRKSLKAHKSVSRKKHFVSYFNDTFDTTTLFRMFLRELLESGCLKIRYYVDVKPVYKGDKINALIYSINWYEHN